MVKMKTALAIVAVITITSLATPASADDEEYDDDASNPAFNMLGFRLSVGALPIDSVRVSTLSVGLGVEHPVFEKTRVFGEAEWLWLTHQDERAMDSVAILPARHGNGQRVSLGIRREIVAKNAGRNVRMFVDGELGGSLALTNDNAAGFALVPAGIFGLRLGYVMYSGEDTSPSRTFEWELLARGFIVQGGVGAMMGLGMAWGN